jgi:hypothetical protein
MSVPCEAEDERRHARIESLGRDPRPEPLDRRLGLPQVRVLVRQADLREGVGDALDRQPLPQGMQRVDHAGEPGVAPEEDQAAPGRVGDQFVVEQRATQVEQPPQHRHVVGLALDHVREEEIALLRNQEGGRDFLDPDDEVACAQIFADFRASGRVFPIRKDANGRGLDVKVQAVLADQRAHILRRERHPALPAVLVLATNPDDHLVGASFPPVPAPGPAFPVSASTRAPALGTRGRPARCTREGEGIPGTRRERCCRSRNVTV